MPSTAAIEKLGN